MDVSLFNGNIVIDVGLSIYTDPYNPSRPLCVRDQDQGLFIPMVCHGHSVDFFFYEPDCDDVLTVISYGSKNIIYLGPDIKFSLDTINKELATILASAYFWEEAVIDASDGPYWAHIDPDYLTLARVSTALSPRHSMEAM
eukprot:15345272-Ditylum_brightwellii.AAC.1